MTIAFLVIAFLSVIIALIGVLTYRSDVKMRSRYYIAAIHNNMEQARLAKLQSLSIQVSRVITFAFMEHPNMPWTEPADIVQEKLKEQYSQEELERESYYRIMQLGKFPPL